MPFIKLQFKPGLNRDQTNYSGEGGWWDCDKIRFRSGFPEKVGGWVKAAPTSFVGVCRQMWNWITSYNDNLLALGTNVKVYIEVGGNYEDITPPQRITTPVNPFITTMGSNVVLVIDPQSAVGPLPTDNKYVRITQAYNVNGISAGALIGVHEATYVDQFSYTITVSDIATSSGSLDGFSATGFIGDVTVQVT